MTRAERKERLAVAIAESYDISDRQTFVAEGSDYDYECQMATDEIAEIFGITYEDEDTRYDDRNSDYYLVNEIVNELMAE